MLKKLLLYIIVASFVILNGCSYKDAATYVMDMTKTSDESDTIVIEKDDTELPVIIMNTDDEEYTAEINEEAEATVEEEYIYDDVNKIYSKDAANSDTTTLAFAGDICFYDDYSNMSVLRQQENGIYGCIKPEVMDGIKAVDILMVNNEFAYSDRGAPTAGKKYAFRSKPSNVSYLDDMGVDIVSLANNHAYDWGPDALVDTIDILNGAKVPFVGAGKNLDEAVKPVYFKINGKTIAYTSATQIERLANPDTKEATADSPGVLRTLDATRFLKVIEEADANSDFTVVYVHWGSENTDLVEQSQRDLAKKYVAAGADLIIGDHPHCLQGIDYVDGIPVFYSLGNFWFNSKTVDTGYVKVTLNSDFAIDELQFVPCVQEGCKTRLAESEKKESILNYLQGISNYANVSSEGIVTKSDSNNNKQNGQNTSPSKKSEENVTTSAEPVDTLTLGPNTGEFN